MKSLVLVAVLSGGGAAGLVLSHRQPASLTAAPPARPAPAQPAVVPARAEVAEAPPAAAPVPAAPPAVAPAEPAPPAPTPTPPEARTDGVMVGPDGVIYQRAGDR